MIGRIYITRGDSGHENVYLVVTSPNYHWHTIVIIDYPSGRAGVLCSMCETVLSNKRRIA